MRRVLDEAVYVAAMLQVQRLLPDRQLHCRVEEEDPVISGPDHTPIPSDKLCLDRVRCTHKHEVKAQRS